MTREASAPSSHAAKPAVTTPALVVEAAGVSAAYDDEAAVVDDVSFAVTAAETLVVVGPSGCGKSTLLRCLNGLLRPTRGTVRLFGRDVWALPSDELDHVRRSVGMAFQGSALFNSLTIGENVALPLREHTQLDVATIRIMTRLKLEQVGLGGSENRMPSELSGGMRKRAGIARALAMDPKLLLLDEPSAGLDPMTAAGLDSLLLKLRSALGLTMIVVTHELESAFRLAHRIVMLDKGRVRLVGTVDDMRQSPDRRVRQFFDREPEEPSRSAERLMDELTR